MAKGIPANVLKLLEEADKRNGFPTGTMQSIMQQETGGNAAYLNDPAKYHYAVNAQGKRVAGHTGKVSTAFGPFGILESTGAKPGYGVAPLKNKSIEEQVRFASEYLAGRSKQAGSLQGGLAGYGEGAKYAKQVISRLPGAKDPQVAQTKAPPASYLNLPDNKMPQLADLPMVQAPVQVPVQAAPVVAAAPTVAQPVAVAAAPVQSNPWGALAQLLPEPGMRPADIDYGNQASMQQQAAMAEEEFVMAQADNSARTQSMLKRFGLGRYSQGLDRYEATIPEFTRTA